MGYKVQREKWEMEVVGTVEVEGLPGTLCDAARVRVARVSNRSKIFLNI